MPFSSEAASNSLTQKLWYADLILKDDTETNITTSTFCYNLWLHRYLKHVTGFHTNEAPGDVKFFVLSYTWLAKHSRAG